MAGLPHPDYQALYTQIGRLLESAPPLVEGDVDSPAVRLWVARAHALIAAVGVGTDAAKFSIEVDGRLGAHVWHESAVSSLFRMLYRALAHCELRSPAAAAGAFIPVGNSFDAFAALSKIMQTATSDVLIIDPYMDETALTEFGHAVSAGVSLRLLTDESTSRPSLVPAVQKWVQQHGSNRPLAARRAVARQLHDRALFVDGKRAWILTQSLKDFAKRSPAEIVRADDTASMKIAAYEAIWAAAAPIQ